MAKPDNRLSAEASVAALGSTLPVLRPARGGLPGELAAERCDVAEVVRAVDVERGAGAAFAVAARRDELTPDFAFGLLLGFVLATILFSPINDSTGE